jgi:hypothetical protein
MRQIIQLAAPLSDYPQTIDALDRSEHTFLLAVRCWVAAHQHDDDPVSRARFLLRQMNVEAATASLDRFMMLAARSTWRRVVIYCPCSRDLGRDERQLLYSACLAQNGASELAAQTLQKAMLTTEGAVLALGPLEEIGEHFAKARKPFLWRQAPPIEAAFPPSAESWLSSLSGTTVH